MEQASFPSPAPSTDQIEPVRSSGVKRQFTKLLDQR